MEFLIMNIFKLSIAIGLIGLISFNAHVLPVHNSISIIYRASSDGNNSVALGTLCLNSVIPSYAGTNGVDEIKRNFGLEIKPEEVIFSIQIYDANDKIIGLNTIDEHAQTYAMYYELPYNLLKNKKEGDLLELTLRGKKYILTCHAQNLFNGNFQDLLKLLIKSFIEKSSIRIGHWRDADEQLIQKGIIERYIGQDCYFGECEDRVFLRHGLNGFKP